MTPGKVIFGMLVVLCLISPARSGEILALGVPGGVAVWVWTQWYGRRALKRMVKARREADALVEANDLLEVKVRRLERRAP